MRCRPGTATNQVLGGSGSPGAPLHFVALHCIRDTSPRAPRIQCSAIDNKWVFRSASIAAATVESLTRRCGGAKKSFIAVCYFTEPITSSCVAEPDGGTDYQSRKDKRDPVCRGRRCVSRRRPSGARTRAFFTRNDRDRDEICFDRRVRRGVWGRIRPRVCAGGVRAPRSACRRTGTNGLGRPGGPADASYTEIGAGSPGRAGAGDDRTNLESRRWI